MSSGTCGLPSRESKTEGFGEKQRRKRWRRETEGGGEVVERFYLFVLLFLFCFIFLKFLLKFKLVNIPCSIGFRNRNQWFIFSARCAVLIPAGAALLTGRHPPVRSGNPQASGRKGRDAREGSVLYLVKKSCCRDFLFFPSCASSR